MKRVSFILAALACLSIAVPASAQMQAGRSPTGAKRSFAVEEDGTTIAKLPGSAPTVVSGTVTTGNTYQSALAANTIRRGCLIQNRHASSALLVFLGAPGSATDATAISVPAGGTFSCNATGAMITSQISVTSVTATAPFVVVSQ